MITVLGGTRKLPKTYRDENFYINSIPLNRVNFGFYLNNGSFNSLLNVE